MKTINVNTKHLENITNLFTGLNQEKKLINIQFEVYSFEELYYMKRAIFETIKFLSAQGSDSEASEHLANVNNLVSIAQQLDSYELHSFVDNLILPSGFEETKSIKQQ